MTGRGGDPGECRGERSEHGSGAEDSGPVALSDGGAIQETNSPEESRTSGIAADEQSSVAGHGEPVTVLHVDDDPLVTDLVADFLERSGDDVTVITETDATVGVARVAAEDVDCVVSDLEMPGMDGLALVRTLANAHSEVPVVLFTSRAWRDVADRAGVEHMTGYVQKGGDPRQLEELAVHVRATLE